MASHDIIFFNSPDAIGAAVRVLDHIWTHVLAPETQPLYTELPCGRTLSENESQILSRKWIRCHRSRFACALRLGMTRFDSGAFSLLFRAEAFWWAKSSHSLHWGTRTCAVYALCIKLGKFHRMSRWERGVRTSSRTDGTAFDARWGQLECNCFNIRRRPGEWTHAHTAKPNRDRLNINKRLVWVTVNRTGS